MDALDFINSLLPDNRKVSDKIFFGIDFDATLVNNDAINLEVDHAVVMATVATWLGEEPAPNTYSFLNKDDVAEINKKVKAVVPPLSDAQKDSLREVLARPNIMSVYLDKKNESVGWPKDSKEYNASMAGKPINKLLCLLAEQSGIDNGDAGGFAAFIESNIIEDIEVENINRLVPRIVTEPFKGWFEALDAFKQSDIPYAIVTSSEYTRVLPVLKSTGLDKYFGIGKEHYDLLDEVVATRKAYKTAKRANADAGDLEKLEKAKKDAGLALHNAIKNSPSVHLYSAKEEKEFGDITEGKPHGDIYGVAFLAEAIKRGYTFKDGALAEDSGSIACILDVAGMYSGSNGMCGAAAGENVDGVNGIFNVIGFIAASHYNYDKQKDKLLEETNNRAKIMISADEIKNYILDLAKTTKKQVDNSLVGPDNQQALATTLAKYTNSLGR